MVRKMLCTKKMPTLEFTRCFANFKWSKGEFQGEVWWTIDVHKVLSIHRKDKAIYFSTGHSWYIQPLRDPRECNVDGESNTERKKEHPTTPHDLVEKYSYNSSNANCISNRCRECSRTKILSGWDEVSSSESSTEGSSSSDEESDEITHTQWTRKDGKMKKLLNMWLKKRFVDSGKKL